MKNVKISSAFIEKNKFSQEKFADLIFPPLQVWFKNGKISFYFVKKFMGKNYNRKIGDYPIIKPDTAREKAIEFVQALASAQNIDAPPNHNLEHVIKMYLQNHQAPCYAHALKYCMPFFKKSLLNLTPFDVENLHAKLSAKKYIANRMVAYLSAAINLYCRKMRLDLPNPCRFVVKYPEEARRVFIPPDKAATFIATLETMATERYYGIQAQALLFAIFTGQRINNCLKLNLKHIHGGQWHILAESDFAGERAKNNKEKFITLNKYALQIVEKLAPVASGGFLFCYRGKPLSSVRKSFKEACRRSGVGDGYRIHDLRRSLATWMLNGGESLTVVAEMLGDTEEVARKHYAHLLPEKVSEATEKTLDRLMAQNFKFKGKVIGE